MSTTIVSGRLAKVLADIFDIPAEDIRPELAAGNIEAWDSFGHVQAILAVEAEYGIRFPGEKIPQLTSVALLQNELTALGV